MHSDRVPATLPAATLPVPVSPGSPHPPASRLEEPAAPLAPLAAEETGKAAGQRAPGALEADTPAGDFIAQVRDGKWVRASQVLQVRQLHHRSGLSGAKLDLVIQSQQQIMDVLCAAAPDAVFEEGLTDLEASRWLRSDAAEDMRELFEGYVPGRAFGPGQRRMLGHTGASMIYALLNPKCELRGATIAAEQSFVDSKLSGIFSVRDLDDRQRSILEDARESLAVDLVSAWRKRNPDKQAALVFGAGHDFRRHWKAAGIGCLVVDAAPLKVNRSRMPQYMHVHAQPAAPGAKAGSPGAASGDLRDP